MIQPIGLDTITGKKKLLESGDIIASTQYKEASSVDMYNQASTLRSYISSSGRHFLGHSGTGSSTDYCSWTFALDNWVSGGKLQIYFTTANDGVKFVKYEVLVTIWNEITKTQETVDLPKVLTATTTTYPQLKTAEVELTSGLLSALGNGRNITFKIIRTDGHSDDDYSGTCYTEIVTFKYNY